VTSDDIMTSLLKKLSLSIKFHVVKPLWSVSKLSTESVGSRRELVADCVHTAADATRRNSTVESRRLTQMYVLGLISCLSIPEYRGWLKIKQPSFCVNFKFLNRFTGTVGSKFAVK